MSRRNVWLALSLEPNRAAWLMSQSDHFEMAAAKAKNESRL
jgi:hypothetical protein